MQVPVFRTERKEDDEEKKAIEQQRNHMIDAAIVRIMKIRKTLKHQQLVLEVIQQLNARFKPHPRSITKRLEALIEQEYLRRDEQERDSYNYLA